MGWVETFNPSPPQPPPTLMSPHSKGPPAAKAAKPNTQLLLYAAGVTYVSTERNSIQLRRTWNPSEEEGKHA